MKNIINKLSIRTKVEICTLIGFMIYMAIGIGIMQLTH